jgi:hypothetical protein
MRHEVVALMWAAHNMGRRTIEYGVGRRSKARTVTARVRPEYKGSRVSYRDDTIYSYHWWPMAMFVRSYHNELAVLVRTDTYSKSTTRHQYHVRDALRPYSVPVFSIGAAPTLDHEANIAAYQTKITELFAKALRAREKVPNLLHEAAQQRAEMQAYAEFFGVSESVWVDPFNSDPAKLLDFEARITKLSIRTGIPIHAFWRKA